MNEHMLGAFNRRGRVVLDWMHRSTLMGFEALKKSGEGTVRVPKEEMSVIEVEAASICGTDLHILGGGHDSEQGIVLGHEYIGRVLEVGSSVTNVKEGDRVAVDPNIKCGACTFCQGAQPNMCENLTTLGIFTDGGFARFNLVPARQLHILPEDLTSERAVLFESLSCAVHGLKKLQGINQGEHVLIYGAGPIGCYFAALSFMHEAEMVVVVEQRSFRRDFVQGLGATAVSQDSDLSGDDFDVVIDAAGAADFVPLMIRHAKRGGRVLLFGQQTNESVEINPTELNQKELAVYGSYATADSFGDTIEILQDPRVPLDNFVTERFPIRSIQRAFEAMRSGDVMKVMIDLREG